MKKFSYLILGAAALLMASCSSEDVTAPSSGDGNFSVTIKLPGGSFGTRSFGDGFTATNLQVAVYDATTENLVTTKTGSFESNSLSTTVTFNLVNGKSYYLAFFAQSAAAVTNDAYKFDANAKTITVNYGNMVSSYNQDIYDCFYKVYPTGVIGTDMQSTTITLTRPVAQVNWGTDDLTDPAVTAEDAYGANAANLLSKVTAKAYNTFNMLGKDASGAVTGAVDTEVPMVEVNLLPLARPTGETYPVPDYQYLSMHYLLAPATSTVYDLTMTVSNGVAGTIQNVIPVTNAPVQANYRTNIYGSLLTNSINYTVTKNADWTSPDNNMKLTWDGTSITYPEVSEEGQVNINQASDLAGLAAMVSGTENQQADDFEGKTIVLAADFDMGGYEFAGIGSTTRNGNSMEGTSFKGEFDGNGKTIRNIVLNGTGAKDETVGFISNLDGEGASFHDVTFEGLTINSAKADQAGVVATVTNGASVYNVTVTGNITSYKGTGGIVGRMILSGSIKQCNNYASVTVSGSNGGGIVGAAYYSKDDESVMTIEGCTNNGVVTCPTSAGGIAGLSAANVTGCTNNGAVNGTSSSVGGIVGWQNATGSVTGCTNNANVTVTNPGSNTYGAGGIVGWVRYVNSNDSYPYQTVIEVSGNTNKGNITGGYTGVGGIVGIWYMCGNCTNNKNYATALSGYQYISGIIGGQQWNEAYPNVEADQKLTITGNTSTTTLAEMTGGAKALICYVNGWANVVMSGNDPDQAQN